MDEEEIPDFRPCSIKQQMILQDMETDVLLVGGGRIRASTLKTTL